MDTTYCPKCNTPLPPNTTLCPKCTRNDSIHKSPIVTLLLCLFLGFLGAHRFYVRKYGTGFLMLATLGGFGMWAFIDLIFIVLNKFEDKNGNLLLVTINPSPLKKAFMVIGSFLVSALLMFVFFYAVIMYASSGIVKVANSQLEALSSGDIAKAYSYTSKNFQKRIPMDAFKSFVNTFPALIHNKNATFTSRSVAYDNGVSIGRLEGKLESTDGITSLVTYQFTKENGGWKVDKLVINHQAPKESMLSPEKSSLPLLFADKEVSYTMNYPENWSYQTVKKGNIQFVNKEGNEAIYIESLLPKKFGGFYEDDNAIGDDYKSQFKKLAPDFTIVDTGKIDLPKNTHGGCFVATYTYQGAALKRMQCIFTRNDGRLFYVWSLVVPAAQFDENVDLAKEMLHSFQIKE